MHRPAQLGKRAARRRASPRHPSPEALFPPYQFCDRFTTALIPASDSPYQFRRMTVPPPIPAFRLMETSWNSPQLRMENAWDLGCMHLHAPHTYLRKHTDDHIRTDTHITHMPVRPSALSPHSLPRPAAQTKVLVVVADCVI